MRASQDILHLRKYGTKIHKCYLYYANQIASSYLRCLLKVFYFQVGTEWCHTRHVYEPLSLLSNKGTTVLKIVLGGKLSVLQSEISICIIQFATMKLTFLPL